MKIPSIVDVSLPQPPPPLLKRNYRSLKPITLTSYALTTTENSNLTENPTMATYEEKFAMLSTMYDEDTVKKMMITAEKSMEKNIAAETLEQEFADWKNESGYSAKIITITKWEKKVKTLKSELPEIPEKFRKKSRVADGAPKITETWKGAGRSKLTEEEAIVMDKKDCKWVLGSIRNIACPYGDHKDGENETKFSNLLADMRKTPIRKSGFNTAEGLEKVRDSTYTTGCRIMFRTKKRMEKHILECPCRPKTTLAPTPPTTETAE